MHKASKCISMNIRDVVKNTDSFCGSRPADGATSYYSIRLCNLTPNGLLFPTCGTGINSSPSTARRTPLLCLALGWKLGARSICGAGASLKRSRSRINAGGGDTHCTLSLGPQSQFVLQHTLLFFPLSKGSSALWASTSDHIRTHLQALLLPREGRNPERDLSLSPGPGLRTPCGEGPPSYMGHGFMEKSSSF